jgi:hypothetical protein
VFWLASMGGTLTVTESHAGETTTYTQSIGVTGSTGTLRSVDSRVVFHVIGPPGDRATVTVTGFSANGKVGHGVAAIQRQDHRARRSRTICRQDVH